MLNQRNDPALMIGLLPVSMDNVVIKQKHYLRHGGIKDEGFNDYGHLSDKDGRPNEYIDIETQRTYTHEEIMEMIRSGVDLSGEYV